MEITLAICMYNAEKYITNTLACVLAQTLSDFELLLIDDCSTDGCVDCAKSYLEENHKKYELFRMPQNQGIAYARNFALHHAHTKYLIFVDSDDCPLPELVEKEYSALCADSNLIAVSSWSQFIDAKGKLMKGGLYIGDTTKENFMKRAQAAKRIFLPIQTMFDRDSALRVGGFCCEGFPEGKPRYRDFSEDMDLWTRMSDLYTEGKYILVLPEVLYRYRKAEGLSSNHFNMIIKMEYVKANLRRRRAGKKELSFIEYYQSLSKGEMQKLRRDSECADCLKNGAFYLREGNIFKGMAFILKSICLRPSYFVNKLKNNYVSRHIS